MLIVTAFKLRDPITSVVHVETGDSTCDGQCVAKRAVQRPRANVFGLNEMLTNAHECESQKIEARPKQRVLGSRVVHRETDAPNVVDRTCFRQYAVAGIQEVLTKNPMLLKLRDTTLKNDIEAVSVPNLCVEPAHLAAKLFRDTGVVVGEYSLFHRRIIEQPRFSPHHVMLGGRKLHTINSHRRAVPLAQTLVT